MFQTLQFTDLKLRIHDPKLSIYICNKSLSYCSCQVVKYILSDLDYDNVNFLFFVMYQFSPFSSVPSLNDKITYWRIYIYMYNWLSETNYLACERLESVITQLL